MASFFRFLRLSFFLLFMSLPLGAGEVILQYFNTSWNALSRRMPELAEAGYTALWLPPPSKASWAGSTGFDNFNRFDFGEVDSRFYDPQFYEGQENWWPDNGKRTLHGTRQELQRLIKIAHRFGIRVYFDNVMAHNSGGLGSVEENPTGQLIVNLPWHVPEDFHVGNDGGNWNHLATINWETDSGDEWKMLNRNPFSWDVALEASADWWEESCDGCNTSFDPEGMTEGSDFPKWTGIRHPGRQELYLDTDLSLGKDAHDQDIYTFANKEPYDDFGLDGIAGTGDEGEGDMRFSWTDTNGNEQHDIGEPSENFEDVGLFPNDPARTEGEGDGIYNMGNIVEEDVNAFFIRSLRYTVDFLKADGFRLDAVKHVPFYFFGQDWGEDKDSSPWGYLGRAQVQFNATRGFGDWSNHRDTVFDGFQFQAVDDLMFFGEHVGEPPGFAPYANTGMRLGTNTFLNAVGNGGIGGSFSGKDNPGWGNLWGSTGVNISYIMSHDNHWLYEGDRKAGYTYLLLRQGLPIVYTDGYNQSGPPSWFPKNSLTPYLGQFSDGMEIMDTLEINRDLIRGYQWGRWSDDDFMAWEMRDNREKGGEINWSETVSVVMMARNYVGGWHSRAFWTGFPDGARLKCYGPNGGWYVNVGGGGVLYNDAGDNPAVPSNGYYVFAWRRPELPVADPADVDGWEGSAIEIYQNGVLAETMLHKRTDGVDGDGDFDPYSNMRENPYAGKNNDPQAGDRSYVLSIPRVTDGSNLRFVATADGSAADILLKLDGGIDLNGFGNDGANRDYPPGRNEDLNANAVGTQSSTNTYEGFEHTSLVHRYTLETGDPSVIEAGVFPWQGPQITQIEGMIAQFEVDGFDATSVVYHPHNDYGEQVTGLEEGYHILRSRAFVNRSDGASIFRTFAQTFYYDTKRTLGLIRWPENDGGTVSGEYGGVILTDDQVTEVWFRVTDSNGTTEWEEASRSKVPTQTVDTQWVQEWKFDYTNIPDIGVANIEVKLLEDSSSSDLSQTDEAGWFTTLERQVNTGSPFHFEIGWPAEGDEVDAGWEMRVWFSNELQGALTDVELIDEFTITIASTVDGEDENPIIQDLSTAVIESGVGWDNYALVFTFPANLYNGDPDFLHYIKASHTRLGLTLSDHVLVRFKTIEGFDGDKDGLLGEWESSHGLDDRIGFGDMGASGDPDGDGYSNMIEYIVKMHPQENDGHLYPCLDIEKNNDGQGAFHTATIYFPIFSGRKHLIQVSDNLTDWYDAGDWVDDWSDINVQWTDDGTITWPHPAAIPRRFYRINYELQD